LAQHLGGIGTEGVEVHERERRRDVREDRVIAGAEGAAVALEGVHERVEATPPPAEEDSGDGRNNGCAPLFGMSPGDGKAAQWVFLTDGARVIVPISEVEVL
jgi:hypothetical protein